MNEAQRLVVARDQFALKRQSDEALRLILPSYEQARDNILQQLKNLPEGAVERELWLRQQLVNIEGQFRAVGNRIYDVLPAEQVKAWEDALDNAKEYLEAGGVKPAGQAVTFTGETTGGRTIEQSLNLPTVDTDYIRPSITQQQIVAAARREGFATLSPGGATRSLDDVLPGFLRSEVQNVERQLRTGFLLGTPTDQIVRDLAGNNQGRAQVEAVVRTSMAEASQAAHNAFFDANEDLLPKTKSGYRWEWDASNDTRLCEICAPLDGARYKERDEAPSIPAHFNCRCRLLPITATAEMLREEGDEPDSSFLERTPVKKGKDGKRLPPPKGYEPVKDGGTAYSRPQKIDGKLYWVRRRDLPKGQTLAGDMLKRMNDENKLGILGTKKRVAEWNTKIKLDKYKNNPQQLVRDMLRPNGGAGAPPMKLGKGPKPPGPKKPPAAPKAKPVSAPIAKSEPALQSSVRKPVGLGKTSTAEPRWADDIDWDELPGKLGYKDYSELDERVEALKRFSGSQYDKMRASQMLDAVGDETSKLTEVGRKYIDNIMQTNGFESTKQLRRDVANKVDYVEELLSRAPRYKGTVYRGMNFDSEADVRSFMEGLRGNTMPTMESWTRKKDIAQTFSSGATRVNAGSYRVMVETSNKYGVSIEDFSSKRGEREVLMPGGIRYEVIGDVEKVSGPNGATIYKVKVRQL